MYIGEGFYECNKYEVFGFSVFFIVVREFSLVKSRISDLGRLFGCIGY